MRDAEPTLAGCRVAIITGETSAFPDMEHFLAPRFTALLAQDETQIQAAVDDPEVRAVLLDLDSVGEDSSDALRLLHDIRQIRDDLVLVAITRSNNRSHQLEGRRILEQAGNKTAFCGLIGASEPMQLVYQAIKAVADSNTTVVLRGESGTGKELIAQAIVQTGNRRDRPYVCLNCSAIPESLIESELFGHEKGAFTGADTAKAGHIESAHGGTLFLDEITTLDHSLQSKLLRVLQERTVQRVGGR